MFFVEVNYLSFQTSHPDETEKKCRKKKKKNSLRDSSKVFLEGHVGMHDQGQRIHRAKKNLKLCGPAETGGPDSRQGRAGPSHQCTRVHHCLLYLRDPAGFLPTPPFEKTALPRPQKGRTPSFIKGQVPTSSAPCSLTLQPGASMQQKREAPSTRAHTSTGLHDPPCPSGRLTGGCLPWVGRDWKGSSPEPKPRAAANAARSHPRGEPGCAQRH